MKHLSISQESIQFQNPAFFKELTLVYSGMRKVKAKDLKESEHAGHLAAVIKRHTKLKVAMDLGDWGPAVEVPKLDKNNPLIQNFNRNWTSSSEGLRVIGSSTDAVTGSVNLKTGEVSGVFAEMQNTMYFPTAMITESKFTDEELAAVTLHEVGHLETYCEYMTRMVTTNQALAGMSRALMDAKTPDERETVLISVKKALKLRELDAVALAKEKDNKVIELVVISGVATECQSELGTNIYDFNSWEYLSDQYAARQGAGRPLVTALDKLYRSSGNISFRSTPTYLAMEALKATLVIGGLVVSSVGALAPFSLGVTRFAVQVGIILIAMDGMGDGTYDRPGVRLKRVRNQVVEEMKNTKISADTGARLTEDLLAIDEVLKTINDREQAFGLIWNIFSKNSRKRMSQEKLAGELEGIAANDLFAEALKMRQLAAV